MPGGLVCILLIVISYLLKFLQSFSKAILSLRGGTFNQVDPDQSQEWLNATVPIAVADTSGSLKSGNKAVILDDVLRDIEVGVRVDNDDDSSAFIIDGQALVQSFKTHGMKTFGDFADEFDSTVFRKGNAYSRIDVLFDRYRDLSIQSGTRTRRAKGKQPSNIVRSCNGKMTRVLLLTLVLFFGLMITMASGRILMLKELSEADTDIICSPDCD
uniref:Uncharacterized protein n=1 Tax=Magallana gigas TaxID=29159 RepID=A0A8W8M8I1_MAGGI